MELAELREVLKDKLKAELETYFPLAVIDTQDIEQMSYPDGEDEKSVKNLLRVVIRNDAFVTPDTLNQKPFVISAVAGSYQYEWIGAWDDIPLNEEDMDNFVMTLGKLIEVNAINHLLSGVLTPVGRKLYFNFVTRTVNSVNDEREEAANE